MYAASMQFQVEVRKINAASTVSSASAQENMMYGLMHEIVGELKSFRLAYMAAVSRTRLLES